MLCSQCGSSEPDSTTVCTSCGSSFDSAAFRSPSPVGFAALEDDTDTRVPETGGDNEPTLLGPSHPPVAAPRRRPPPSPEITMAPATPPGRVAAGSARRPTPGAGGSESVEGIDGATQTGPLSIGQQFGRYTIIRLLGAGGMGAVYQAWDEELEVPVALKVVRPEAIATPAAARQLEQRFKRELLLARQVTHHNVVRIHDLGEIQGIKYITMSYVQGVDLATLLARDGPLPVPKALRIYRGVVAGLQAAHEAGVLHRDLKPANIMVEGRTGEALIMDFGIARLSGAEGDDPSRESGSADTDFGTPSALTNATMAGTVVGTVAYMAPEQARAEGVDGRADIYSLGLIVYDMLLGRARFERGASPIQELMKRQAEAPPSPRSIDPAIPEPLDAILRRSLQPRREDRQAGVAALAGELARLDEEGRLLPPIRRLTGRMLAAAAAVLVALVGGTWWYVQRLIPEAPHDPVSVLIADFRNRTGDPGLDGTLEPTLKRALEGASFISAYDRLEIRRTLGVPPPETLDVTSARELAVNQGVGVVLSGSMARLGSGFELVGEAVEALSGEVIVTARERASGEDRVLEAAAKLATRVRAALGDDASESAQMFAMTSLSATSLDVVRHYAAAQEAASNGQFEEARQSALKAVALDPKFGVGYQLLAVASRNLGRVQDADGYIKEALNYLDGMTERERYSTRGMFFRLAGDYQPCVKEYGELIARYAADVAAHNQRALCLSKLRDTRGAVDAQRRVVELLPNRAIFRDNLALYLNYDGDFRSAEQEARTVGDADAYATLALAFAQLGQGRLPAAREALGTLGTIGALGASFAASGLGDLATLEGRFSDAVRILGEGAAADLASKNPDRAASKFAALAYAQLLRGEDRGAIAAADQALANSQAAGIRFLAARILVEAGDTAKALPLAAGLAAELQAEPQAFAKIVEGNAALRGGDPRRAIVLLREANGLLDTWIGHFDLGRAYLGAGEPTYADAEFDRCFTRRGQALSLLLDEWPTYGYFPQVYYYQGRVREALNHSRFGESYGEYLSLREKAGEDPLLADVRRRAGR